MQLRHNQHSSPSDACQPALKNSRPFSRLAGLATGVLVLGNGVATVPNAWADDPLAPPKLSSVSVPLPDSSHLGHFIKDESDAVELGKALFWDMAVGSDGIACASCHFHAGVDNRIKNQLSPGLNRVSLSDPMQSDSDETFQMTASGGQGGPNYTLQKQDFPFHQFNDPDSRSSGVKFSTNDVTSSQGTFGGDFIAVPSNNELNDICSTNPDPVFHVGGIGIRKVEPRNAPSFINSIFNFRNFWDGRANNIFNGVDGFGKRSNGARIFRNDGRAVRVDLRNGALASQAVETVNSNFEMVCANRSIAQLGQKLIPRYALAAQKVHEKDSELRYIRASNGVGLEKTYREMIEDAFEDEWWDGYQDFGGFSQMEANFSLFFGLSVQLYQATLVSDEAPYDEFAAYQHDSFDPSSGRQHKLTSSQRRGLDIFLNEGKCINCHKGSEFSGAASVLQHENEENGLVERMRMGDNGIALYDQGFYNIGVTPTHEDIGVGGRDPFNNPLSFTEQYVNRRHVDPFHVDICTFEEKFSSNGHISGPAVTIYSDWQYGGASQSFGPGHYNIEDLDWNDALSSIKVPRGWRVTLYEHADFSGSDRVHYSDEAWVGSFNDRTSSIVVRDAEGNTENTSCGHEPSDLSKERVAVLGAFKVPILRNVELTGPYMHNGSMSTLEQVVEFYNRGGNFRNHELDADIRSLGLSSSQKADLVAFLKSLTDPRVANEEEPFDHPQLFVPNGHPGDEFSITDVNSLNTSMATDDWLEIPAIGKYGRSQEGLPTLKPFQPAGVASPRSSSGPSVTFYSDAYFGGATLSLQAGSYDIHDLGWFNDQISSLKIPAGVSVEMFDHPGFHGSNGVQHHDNMWVGGFNDRASSIIIRAH